MKGASYNWTDVRNVTHKARVDIGYDGVKEAWSTAPAVYDEDTLTICGHPVMERWEDEYMHTLARVATQHKGTVLEVGFGMGISATYIQSYTPGQHIIIEANTNVLKHAREFVKHAKHPIMLLHGFWEEVVEQIEDNSIDGILFDTYPLTEADIHQNHFPFFKEAYRMLRPGGILTYYSDEVDAYSEIHRRKLMEAGFVNISGHLCHITPPKECQYWKGKSLLVPVVTK